MASPNLSAFLPKAVPSSSIPRLYYSPNAIALGVAFEFPIPTSQPLIDVQLRISGKIESR